VGTISKIPYSNCCDKALSYNQMIFWLSFAANDRAKLSPPSLDFLPLGPRTQDRQLFSLFSFLFFSCTLLLTSYSSDETSRGRVAGTTLGNNARKEHRQRAGRRCERLGLFPEIEEPVPRLWHGFFNSPGSVPPLWEYGRACLLRDGFTNIKSRLNNWKLCTGAESNSQGSCRVFYGLEDACTIRAPRSSLCEHV